MKTFSIWLVAALTLYAALAGGWHIYLTANPHSLAIVLDSSYPMQHDWPRLTSKLEEFTSRRYTRFALVTEKGLQHSWNDTLQAARVAPYAPRDFTLLQSLANSQTELSEADEVIFITNATVDLPAEFAGWEIVRP